MYLCLGGGRAANKRRFERVECVRVVGRKPAETGEGIRLKMTCEASQALGRKNSTIDEKLLLLLANI